MAKYTELFIEYCKDGGELPDVFDEIDGFEDLFIAHFADKEIGFETEDLFKIKLFARAEQVIPAYVERIKLLKKQYKKVEAPAKIFYEKTKIGEQVNKTTELPIDATTAEPSMKSESEEYENEINREEKGQNTDEVIKMLNELNSKVNIITAKLLSEFDSLFMQVY